MSGDWNFATTLLAHACIFLSLEGNSAAISVATVTPVRIRKCSACQAHAMATSSEVYFLVHHVLLLSMFVFVPSCFCFFTILCVLFVCTIDRQHFNHPSNGPYDAT